MIKLRVVVMLIALTLTCCLKAQNLAFNNISLSVGELPEYIVINCDNHNGGFVRSIRISIQSEGSAFERPLEDLERLLGHRKYLNVANQTDLLNTMSKLGFDYVNAFPENASDHHSDSRSGFVFRKKEVYRN